MIYLVDVQEITICTLEVEARNIQEAENKAAEQNYLDRDDWDKDIVAITNVRKKINKQTDIMY